MQYTISQYTDSNTLHVHVKATKINTNIPAVSTPLGLHVMVDGFLAAPEAGVSVETWKQQHIHRRTHVKTDKCTCDT